MSGKVALITGVSSGVGAGVAKMFAKAGATVVGCARKGADSQEANDFVESVRAENREALYVPTDVTDNAALKTLVERAVGAFGQIDILVSNAGVNIFEGVEACTDERWNYNMQLNLASHWKLAQYCKPHLEKQRGVVIVITSNHAFASIPGCFPYNVAKTALTGLVRSIAIEWGPSVRCVGLAPGFIDTAGNDAWFNSFPDPALERQRTINLHPAGKIGTAEETGAWCVFLASNFGAFATGTTYLLDGGRSALMQDH